MLAFDSAIDFRGWADECLTVIERQFRSPSGIYREWAAPESHSAFLWGYGTMLSAAAAAMRVDPRHDALFDAVLASLEPYWVARPGASGYAVQPNMLQPDRYYDDNAWVALAFIDAFEATGRRDLLQRAVQVHRFVMSGEDEKLGGGIYWHEGTRAEKNTCVNAPAILSALRLHRLTGRAMYLGQANRLAVWLKRLQDEDGLYWDHQKLDGSIEKTKWAYNTAVMIRAHAERYRQTQAVADRETAIRMGQAARARWVNESSGAIRDESFFAHHLVEAFLDLADLDPAGGWREVAQRGLAFAINTARDSDGLVGKRWDEPPVPGERRLLLFTASLARTLWVFLPAHPRATSAQMLRGR